MLSYNYLTQINNKFCIMLDNDQEVSQCNFSDENKHNLSPALVQAINKIIQAEGYVMHSIYVSNILMDGEAYLSILQEVDIKGKTVFNCKETNLFIKQCLIGEETHIVSPQDLFLREIFFYTDLAKVFDELQNEFNVPDEEKFIIVKCYNNCNVDSIILENMVKQGFKTYNRMGVMPVKAMELSIRMIAKFHAFSMVLKQYRPDYYKHKIQNLKHPFSFKGDAENFYKVIYKLSVDVLPDDRKIKIEKYLPDLLDKFDYYVSRNESKTKCLCHGDVRMNNFLVKETDGEATKVIPIDYQILYYGSPVIDLIQLIFISSDQDMRANELENLKSVYFESLKKFLNYFSIEVESVYPYQEFQNDFQNQLDYGLIMPLVFLPFIMATGDDVPEFNDKMKKIQVHDNFKPRVQGIVDDFIQWGYL